MTTKPEVLPEVLEAPQLGKRDALSLERQARRHYQTGVRNLMFFAVDLRRLQDGGAHFTRHFDNFGDYVEHTFDGLTAANAKQLSRQGAVLLALERAGRVTLEGHARDLPGSTGLRALASVLNQYGEATMVAAFDRAAALRPGRVVVAETVNQAMRTLVAPPAAPPALEPAAAHPDDIDDEFEDEDHEAALDIVASAVAAIQEAVSPVRDLDPAMRSLIAPDAQHQLAHAETALAELRRLLRLPDMSAK